MSAELLREAATVARDEWEGEQSGPFRNAARVHLALADLLDREAADQEKRLADLRSAFGEAGDDFMPPCDPLLVATARAYLGAT